MLWLVLIFQIAILAMLVLIYRDMKVFDDASKERLIAAAEALESRIQALSNNLSQ